MAQLSTQMGAVQLGTVRNVRLWIRKQPFEPIAAAQNDLLLGHVGFVISERKQLVGADLVA